MKKITAILSLLFISSLALGQVEIGKAKNTIMGKGKLVATPVSELLIDNFQLTFNLYKFAEDQGGGRAQVGVRARLGGVDDALAGEITNEAYAYFVEGWKKRNISITMADKAVMMKSKPYTKAAKKDKASIVNGGVFDDRQKKIAYHDGLARWR